MNRVFLLTLSLWMSLLACGTEPSSPATAAAVATSTPSTQVPSGAASPNTTASSPNATSSSTTTTSTPTPSGTTGGDGNTASSPNVAVTEDPNHPSSGPTVRTVGRFDSSDPNLGAQLSWPATTMLTRVQGTGVNINLTSGGNMTYQGLTVSSWFDVFVDGAKTSTFSLTPGVTSYVAASGLDGGDHIVQVTKRTEPQMGYASFYGFVATGNSTLLPAPLARSRKIEFIGDSITAGYGAEGNVATFAGCPNFTIATENAGATFASMAAANLGAEFSAIAYSGKGILQNDDCTGDPTYTLPVLYSSILPNQSSDTWDFNSWVPQAVVINLGTNDYNENNGCGIPTDSAFTNAWTSFLQVVRGNYPNAYILCTVGPEVPSANLARVRSNIQAAVSGRNSAGDPNVGYVALAPDTGANGYGCGGHPNQATHALMANVIEQALAAAVDW